MTKQCCQAAAEELREREEAMSDFDDGQSFFAGNLSDLDSDHSGDPPIGVGYDALTGGAGEKEEEPEETDEERRDRYVREIETQAEEATEKEVDRLEAAGETVSETRREKIYAGFEDKYMAEMARYESLRKQNEALRAEWIAKLKHGVEAYGSLHARMFSQMRVHGLNVSKVSLIMFGRRL